MSDDALFSQFRAITLKALLKWIENPRNKRGASTLEKYIPIDKGRDMTSKKLTNPVKVQLIEINKLSIKKRQFIREIIENTNNLRNETFINNVINENGDNSISLQLQCTLPLIESYKMTERELIDLDNKINTNQEKLSMLNELSATMLIPEDKKQELMKQLNINKMQRNGYKFRKNVLIQIINKIKKKENKLIENENKISLQTLMEKIILSKNKSLIELKKNLNAINTENNAINHELMILCSDTMNNSMNKIHEMQQQKKQKQNLKINILQKINDSICIIEGVKTLKNEIVCHQSIDYIFWFNLSSNNNDNNNKWEINENVNNDESSKHSVQKKKFKRPSCSKVIEAKTIRICDVLPSNIFPIKLSSNFISNGSIRNESETMFDSNTQQRDDWINQYNLKYLPSIKKRYKSIYGNDINLKPINIHKLENRKKRKIDELNIKNDNRLYKKMKMNEMKNEYINDSPSNSPLNLRMNKDKNNIILSIPDDIMNENEYKNNKQSKQCLNINATKHNIFKPNHHKRHRVKLPLNNKNNKMKQKKEKDIDLNHPLIINDPLNKINDIKYENETFDDGECLHFIARGFCGFLERGCPYKHPSEFDAKNIYCFTLKKGLKCNRNSCKYSHNLADIPCKHFYERNCERNNCLKSHQFTNNEYKMWCITKEKRDKAFKKWINIKNKKNYKKDKNDMNVKRNASLQNDERLNNITSHPLFTSALTE